MATTGLEVFDKTLHTTNLWLDEINAEIGPDRHLAWHVLGAVLRSIRDEMQVEQSAHFAAQLPLLIRGAYFDQYRPAIQPASVRSQEEFISRVQDDLEGARPVKTELAVTAVLHTLNRHVTEGQVKKVRDALPKGVRAMWPEPEHKEPEPRTPGQAKTGMEKPDQPGQQQRPQSGAKPSAQAAQQHSESPQPASQQAPPPRPAAPEQHAGPSLSASSQHRVAPQTSQHPEPQRPAREWDDIDQVDVAIGIEDEEISFSKGTSSKTAHAPVGASSRPAAVHAAPASDRPEIGSKAKARTKRKEG